MKTTTPRAIFAGISAWILVKIQEFMTYASSVDSIDWSAVGVTAVSELMTGLIALAALFTDVKQESPVAVPVERKIGEFRPAVRLPAKDYFSSAELDCKCPDYEGCDYQGMDAELIAIANDLREQFGPLVVTSAYRCPEHNRRVGGSANSYHVQGKAIDLKSGTVSPDTLYSYLDNKYPKRFGLGLYKTFIHIDVRSDGWARKTSAKDQWQAFEYKPDLVLS